MKSSQIIDQLINRLTDKRLWTHDRPENLIIKLLCEVGREHGILATTARNYICQAIECESISYWSNHFDRTLSQVLNALSKAKELAILQGE